MKELHYINLAKESYSKILDDAISMNEINELILECNNKIAFLEKYREALKVIKTCKKELFGGWFGKVERAIENVFALNPVQIRANWNKLSDANSIWEIKKANCLISISLVNDGYSAIFNDIGNPDKVFLNVFIYHRTCDASDEKLEAKILNATHGTFFTFVKYHAEYCISFKMDVKNPSLDVELILKESVKISNEIS